jgi:hypothetical protein
MDRLIASDGNLLISHHKPLGQESINRKTRSYVRKIRKKKIPSLILSKKEKALCSDEILLVHTKECCSQGCCQHIQREVVRTVRERYWSKSYEDRKQEQINAITNTLHLVDGEKIVVLEGIAVCLEASRLIHNLGRTQFYTTKNAVIKGVKIPTHGNIGKRRMTERVSQAYMSIKGIIHESADHHPTKLRTMADNSR